MDLNQGDACDSEYLVSIADPTQTQQLEQLALYIRATSSCYLEMMRTDNQKIKPATHDSQVPTMVSEQSQEVTDEHRNSMTAGSSELTCTGQSMK